MAELVPVYIMRTFSETVNTGGIVLSFDSVSIVFSGDVIDPPIIGASSVPSGISVGFAGGDITIAGSYGAEQFYDTIVQYRASRADPTEYSTTAFDQIPGVVYALTKYRPDFRSQFTITYRFTIFISEAVAQFIITQEVYNDYDLMLSTFFNKIETEDLGS